MRRRTGTVLALAALSSAMLAGCTPEAPVETTPPPTSAAPTVSEEEARAAWEAYQSRLSELDDDPGAATREDFLDVATDGVADAQLENFETADGLRLRIDGPRTTTRFDYTEGATALVCIDVSQERYIQNETADVTPTDSPEIQAFEAAFERNETGAVVVSKDVREEEEDVSCSA